MQMLLQPHLRRIDTGDTIPVTGTHTLTAYTDAHLGIGTAFTVLIASYMERPPERQFWLPTDL